MLARNRAAKALNIGMGVPLFQIQDVIERHNVALFSACYALYQDLSDRIMAVLARFGVAQEVYSIDECWLDVSHVPDGELEEAVSTYAVAVMEKVRRQGSRVGRVSVFIQTNPWKTRAQPYAKEASAKLPYASAYTPDVLDLAQALLGTIYVPGYRYKRAGVYVVEFSSQKIFQHDLFGVVASEGYARQECVMALVHSCVSFKCYPWTRYAVYHCTRNRTGTFCVSALPI
ncbi:hypothetical protein KSD_95300 [Ktedonobacter sp. SOSP1-85]|nr:hypothetical protein KSD_95300 [Ktedonobacter sp. SOSP1-85]